MLPTLALIYNILTTPVASLDAGRTVVASHTISLENRYNNSYVNDVFKDNILLTLNYMDGKVTSKSDINWDNVTKPFNFEFTLNPKEKFTFHDYVLPEYDKNIVKTTNAHFNYTDGFKSDGYLMGDGVCHLASLIYWVSKDAGLDAVSPRNHNFAIIPEIPKEYGVSIYFHPDNKTNSGYQNLYITNNKEYPVTFSFNYDGVNLQVKILEER